MRNYLFLLLLVPLIILGQETDTISNQGSFAAFPAVSYAPETSLQIGAVGIWVLKDNSVLPSAFQRQSTITPYVVYTLKKQSIAVVNLDYYFPSGQNLTASVRYYNFPDSYFGIGNENDPDISEMYTNRFVQLEGQFLHPLNEKFFIGAAYDAHFTKIKKVIEGGLLETDNPIGINGGGLFGIGPALRFDTRDYTIYPTKGYFISSRLMYTGIGDFNYTSFLLDVRKYFSIVNDRNIIALQFRSQWTGGTDIPFYKLPQLAGDERLRGIKNASLYRDRQMMYTQVEYRRPLFWRFGMTLFAGIGDVAQNIEDFDATEFKYVAGIGGRMLIIPERKLNIRVDLGFGKGGQNGIYVGISEAF
ncbi:BamA/TamA family outer membrane protein [Ekhidna sp.]|uniref:BamA/TamA family outer membrane protein n=1 Tax=Ekhidna sp. TaxID=2608089 RepID=UPI003B502CA1